VSSKKAHRGLFYIVRKSSPGARLYRSAIGYRPYKCPCKKLTGSSAPGCPGA
jgi:hypothetical protein